MKRLSIVAWCAVFVIAVLFAGNVVAGQVKLDISSSFDYDAFGTDSEIAYADTQLGASHHLFDIQGDHNVNNDANTTTYFAGTNGVPLDGLVDDYELGLGLVRKWDSIDGQTKVDNCAAWGKVNGDGSVSNSTVITLSAGDQKRYSDINFLLTGLRYNSTDYSCSAKIEVKYVGESAWNTLWYSAYTNGDSSATSGMFGWKWNTTNGYDETTWMAIDLQTNTTAFGCEGWQTDTDGFPHTIKSSRDVYSYMYKFNIPLTLDDSKFLESIRFIGITSHDYRYVNYQIYAATATEAPAAKGFEIIGW